MIVVQSETFESDGEVALRLPDEIAFPSDIAVTIERKGDTITIRPKQAMAHYDF
ncbi:MAG: hypothetical protein V4574_03620 [Pseudomonadota bacterium]